MPVEPAGSVLTDHAVAVRDGNIEAVLPAGEARQRFPGYEQVDLPEHVLIPGLVNAHTHAAMTLMRGLADDLPLMRWLEEHIWPAEKRHVSAQFVRDGTLAACAEMLRGGITCFNDMYFFPDAALESALEAGMRSVHGIIVIEFPSAYAADAADYLRKGLEVRDRYRDERLASFCIAPHAPYTVADASLRQVAVLAAELDLPVHMHVHETEHEVQGSLAEHGMRPLERLRRCSPRPSRGMRRRCRRMTCCAQRLSAARRRSAWASVSARFAPARPPISPRSHCAARNSRPFTTPCLISCTPQVAST